MRSRWINSFSWFLAAFGLSNAIVQPPMVLRQDQMGIVGLSEKVRELTPMVSCVEKIARGWFPNKERVPLLIPDFLGIPGLSKAFFTGLQEEVATFSVTEDFPNSTNYRASNAAVILVRNSTDFYSLSNLNQLCAPRCRYVVCLLKPYDDEKSLLDEAESVVNAMWASWIVNLVIVASTAGKFVVAGSYSFETTTRVPSEPKILGECSTLGTERNEYIFHKLLLNNSQVNITTSECLPYAGLAEEDGHEVLTGIEGDMFEVLASAMNMSLNRLNISFSVDSNDSIYDNLLRILDSPEGSDVAFCGLYWSSTSEKLEYSVTYDRQEIVWLVPSIPSLNLLGLVTPLDISVWFAVIGLLIFTGIMKVFLFRKLSFLSVVGLVLGIALPQQPKRLSSRIQFASWIFFGYIITQSYLASLAGQLMNANYEMIATMEQLVQSGISFGGTDRHRDLFKEDENPVSHKIYQNYQILSTEEYQNVMDATMAGENHSMALIDEIEISAVKSHPGLYAPHKLDETLASYPVAIAVWKGLPYLEEMNHKIAHLRQGGFVAYWSQKHNNRNTRTNTTFADDETESIRNLDMLHLSPSFFLLLIGHALSIVVFVIEIGIYARKNKVRFIRRNKAQKKVLINIRR